MKINSDDKVQIKLVMMNGNEPAFIEFTGRNGKDTILRAERFCDSFGWSMDNLRAFNRVKDEKDTTGEIK